VLPALKGGVPARPSREAAGHWRPSPTLASRADPNPLGSVLDFHESAYQTGARLAGWDIQRLTALAGSPTDTFGCAAARIRQLRP
jgi:hypothetical protein